MLNIGICELKKLGGRKALVKNEKRTRILKLKVINARGLHARASAKFASTVDRDSALLSSLGGSLGLTEEQLDDMFKLAATL